MTEGSDASAREADLEPQPLPAVPRRIQELKESKNHSRRRSKASSRDGASKDSRPHHGHRWRQEVVSDLEAGASFSTQIEILKILCRIPELRDHVPQLVSNNPVARTYTIHYTRRELVPFEEEARWIHLSSSKIQGFKNQLYKFIKLMYKNGVRYNLYPQHLYLYRPASWEPTRQLFLGSVAYSDLLDTRQLDWKAQKDQVWAQIDRIFAPLEIWAFQQESTRLSDYAKDQMDWVNSTIAEKNIIIDAARADLKEARAIMREAYEAIKNARASIEGITGITQEFHDSVSLPRCEWDDAQLGKEYMETSLKKAQILDGRVNTLIQKYRNPKANDGANTEDVVGHDSTEQKEMAETKSTADSSVDSVDDTKAEETVATQDGVSTADGNLKEETGPGT